MIRLLIALPLLLATPSLAQETLAVPSFVEETASAGLDTIYDGQWQYMVGGGVAAFDCNADGLDELYVAGGLNPAGFYLNRSEIGGALKFEKAEAGLSLDAVTGAYPIDIDSDGITDLVVLRVGESVAMRGLGECRFERANEAWGFDGGDAWWTAFAAVWEKDAAWPTLALGSYVDRTLVMEPWGSCTDNRLTRPNAAGTGFAAPVPLKPSFCPLSMLFTDWDLSGTPALRVSNDREYYMGGTEQLWRVPPGADPVLYGPADGWKTLKIWGMGIASGDVTGDGYPDYFITSMADNKLQTLASTNVEAGKPLRPDYKDVAFPRGAHAQRPYTGGDVRPSTAWHTQFVDFNQDGRLDIFIAKGNVSTMPDFAHDDPNNLLLQGADGRFVEVGDKAGVASMENSRGGAVTDLNLDGLPDLVVVNRWEPPQLWRNASTGLGHWLQLRPAQDGTNRDAVGGWLEVKTGDLVQRREITIGGGHVSGQLGFWHFGLGAATEAEVRVILPGGEAGEWGTVAADGFYRLSRDGAEAWTPGG